MENEVRQETDNGDIPRTGCAFCGADLPAGRFRFCSTVCKDAFNHYGFSKAELLERTNRPCLWCGKPFVHKQVSARFCCRSCSQKYAYHGNRSKAEVERDSRRTCPVCGKEYVAALPKQVYCSQTCWAFAKTHGSSDGGAGPGAEDAYAELLRLKTLGDDALAQEMYDVLALSPDDLRTRVSSWPDEKRRILKEFYVRRYGLSSGRMTRVAEEDERVRQGLDVEGAFVGMARDAADTAVFDEDNLGFEAL